MNASELYDYCIEMYRKEILPKAHCGNRWCGDCEYTIYCDMLIIAKNMILEGGLMIWKLNT